MAEIILGGVLGALLTVVFTTVKDWLLSLRSIRVSVTERSGPTSHEHGFAEKAVEVTVMNRGAAKVEIQDIRLIFARNYGASLIKAPLPRSHPELPATLDSGTAEVWYFPAEKLASLLQSLSSKFSAGQRVAKLRPRVTTTTGKVYRARRTLPFSMDVNSHWQL